MPLAPGEIVGRFRVESLVGRGGMGEVYRAWDPDLARPVALKTMRDDASATPEEAAAAAGRFAREARLAARFVHPLFCALYDVVEHRGRSVLVMEWIDGTTLRARAADARVGRDARLAWLVALGRALADAHDAGVVHRDFKPGNVLVTPSGDLKIVDFGLAKRVAGAATLTAGATQVDDFRTRTGDVVGTLRYMAPEQVLGAAFDARGDQFAWGTVAYELLSGVHPAATTGDDGFPLSPPRPLDAVADVGPAISAVVMRALAAEPGARHPTTREAADALERAGFELAARAGSRSASGTLSAAPRARDERPARAEAKRPGVLFAASGVVGFVIAAGASALVLRAVARGRDAPAPAPSAVVVASSSAVVVGSASAAAIPVALAPSAAASASAAPSSVAPPPHGAMPPPPHHGGPRVAVVDAASKEPADAPFDDRPLVGRRHAHVLSTLTFMSGWTMQEAQAALEPHLPAVDACLNAAPSVVPRRTLHRLVVSFDELGHVVEVGFPVAYECVVRALASMTIRSIPRSRPSAIDYDLVIDDVVTPP